MVEGVRKEADTVKLMSTFTTYPNRMKIAHICHIELPGFWMLANHYMLWHSIPPAEVVAKLKDGELHVEWLDIPEGYGILPSPGSTLSNQEHTVLHSVEALLCITTIHLPYEPVQEHTVADTYIQREGGGRSAYQGNCISPLGGSAVGKGEKSTQPNQA